MRETSSLIKDPAAGKVYLLGAGPGDPGLITVKGFKCITLAEVIVYDHLVNKELLDSADKNCEMIYVGKEASRHTLSQEEISMLLVAKAKEGKTVVRLKGGDPYVFGRGGEEALLLNQNGIPFEIVPGVTAAVAALAYAGIPITQRGLSSTAALITGHEMPGKPESDINWEKISTGAGTLVFYMGVKNLPNITAKLKENGRPAETPAAVIQWGTLPRQKTVTGTLDTIVEKVKKEGITPPALIAVGEVVSLKEKLSWFDKKPLFGKRIVITRSRNQASRLGELLKELGAEVIQFPSIEIVPVKDTAPLDAALNTLSDFTWIVFTSVNGVDIFFERLFLTGDSRDLAGKKIAVIGEETGKRLRNYGLKPDLIPGAFTSEGVVSALKGYKNDFTSDRVLIPGSAIAREIIADELGKMGAEVTQISIYQNLLPAYSSEEIDRIFKVPPDLITFTSSSTVKNLFSLLGENKKLLSALKGASIGPVTSAAARELGLCIEIEAETYTIEGLVQAINKYFNKKEKI